jgi:hypothetical protein
LICLMRVLWSKELMGCTVKKGDNHCRYKGTLAP